MQFNDIIQEVVFKIPELTKLKENTERDYGKSIEYMFFFFLMKFYIDLYRNSSLQSNVLLMNKISIFIEKMICSDDEDISTLAVTGFLEYLDVTPDELDNIKKTFGKKTQRYLKQMYR